MTREKLEEWFKDRDKLPIQIEHPDAACKLVAMHRSCDKFKADVKVIVYTWGEDKTLLDCNVYTGDSFIYLLDVVGMKIDDAKFLMIDEYMLGLA